MRSKGSQTAKNKKEMTSTQKSGATIAMVIKKVPKV
jgi:hypothetical protein